MRVFEVQVNPEQCEKWDLYRMDALHRWLLPGVHCDVCGATWGGAGTNYPCVDLSDLPDQRPYKKPWPVSMERLEELRRPIVPRIPGGRLPPPGAAFGPLVGRLRRCYGDVIWWDYSTRLFTRSALERLGEAGVVTFRSAPAQLRTSPRKDLNYLEPEIEPHALLAPAVLPPGGAPPCPRCGRRALTAPERVTLLRSSIPADKDLFRGEDLTTYVYASERFAEAAQRLGLTGVAFTEVELAD